MGSRSTRADEVLNVVDLIYGSATDPTGMPRVLRAFNELVEGTSSQIYTRDKRTGAVSNSQISDTAPGTQEAHAQYVSYWGARDPRAALLASLPSGQVLRCHERFDEQFVSSSDFYQDFFIPHGFRWALGGSFDAGNGASTIVGNVRASDLPPFQEWTAAVLGQLLPHFQRASFIASKLQDSTSAESVGTRLMSHLPVPCLLTDQRGRCIEGNDGFTRSIGKLALRLVTGRVRFSHPERQRQWEHALLETEATALARSIEMTGATGSPVTVHLIPWRSVIGGPDAADKRLILAVFAQAPVLEAPPHPGAVAGMAGLTRAEFEVMAALLQGLPAKTIAARRSAAVNTVRSQISTILQKTGHSSQKELIASFGSSSFGSSAFGSSTFESVAAGASRSLPD